MFSRNNPNYLADYKNKFIRTKLATEGSHIVAESTTLKYQNSNIRKKLPMYYCIHYANHDLNFE